MKETTSTVEVRGFFGNNREQHTIRMSPGDFAELQARWEFATDPDNGLLQRFRAFASVVKGVFDGERGFFESIRTMRAVVKGELVMSETMVYLIASLTDAAERIGIPRVPDREVVPPADPFRGEVPNVQAFRFPNLVRQGLNLQPVRVM